MGMGDCKGSERGSGGGMESRGTRMLRAGVECEVESS